MEPETLDPIADIIAAGGDLANQLLPAVVSIGTVAVTIAAAVTAVRLVMGLVRKGK